MSDFNELVYSMDGRRWAQEFIDTISNNDWSIEDIDVDLMTTWFSCSIMSGYDGARRKILEGDDL